MKVENVEIYGLENSVVASGYPMRTVNELSPPTDKDWRRAANLIKAVENDNQAHGQFLTGIIVQFDLTFSNKAWVECERYKFMDFISSESTMHRIAKFDIDKQCNEYVDERAKAVLKELVCEYENDKTPENYLKVLYNIPSGFELTARMTTNYRCLRNIYQQRKNHRLPEWREFCKWIESLPHASTLLIPHEVEKIDYRFVDDGK